MTANSKYLKIASYIKYMEDLGNIEFIKEGNIWFAKLNSTQKQKLLSYYDRLIKEIEDLYEYVKEPPLLFRPIPWLMKEHQNLLSSLEYTKGNLLIRKEEIKRNEKFYQNVLIAYFKEIQNMEKTIKDILPPFYQFDKKLAEFENKILQSLTPIKNIMNNLIKAIEELSKLPYTGAKALNILGQLVPVIIIGTIAGVGWVIYKVIKEPEKYEKLVEKLGAFGVKYKT
jgi:hypothetical protein